MRYYDLDTNGKVKGSYAVPQPEKELHLLEDAPDNESKRDGVPGDNWIPDTDIIDARLAEEERITAKVRAIADNLPSRKQIKTAINAAFPDTKQSAIITKLATVLYWLAKNQAD